jgi:hypothetical protein
VIVTTFVIDKKEGGVTGPVHSLNICVTATNLNPNQKKEDVFGGHPLQIQYEIITYDSASLAKFLLAFF